MKIHRIYKEGNEIENLSGDKVQIEMTEGTFSTLRSLLNAVRFEVISRKEVEKAESINNLIEKAIKKQTSEWV